MESKGEEWFRDLYMTYSKKITTKIHRVINDEMAAKDLTQDVFLLLFENAEKLKGHPKIAAWLYKVAGNYTCNYIKLRQRRGDIAITDEVAALLRTRDIEESSLDTFERILTKEELELLKLKILGGYTFSELASYYGATEGACKMRIKRIYEKVKQNIKEF